MIPQVKDGSVPMVVTYHAKPGQADALQALVMKHWPVVHALGLATSTPARVWKATDREGKVWFVEMFEWKDADAPRLAHQAPEVMAVWGPMDGVMERIEIAHTEQLQ